MKNMKNKQKIFTKKEILPICIIIFSAFVGFALYPQLPHEVPVHWGPQGVVDAWFSKNLAVIFFPVLILLIYLMLTFIFLFDPLKKNYFEFSEAFFWFRTIMVLFLSFIYLFSLTAAIKGELDIIYFIIPTLSLFLIYLGLFLPSVKRNYFIGIRTPWTLHSEKVWDKTHYFSGKIFIGAGILSFFSILFSEYAFYIFLFIILGLVFIPSVYSYYLFLGEKKK